MSSASERPGGVTLREIRALLRLLQETDIEELEVERDGTRIRIRRRGALVPTPPSSPPPAVDLPPAVSAPAQVPAAGPQAPSTAGLVTVEAPMVGTFYRAPSPGAEPYVKEGDVVEKGTVLCIIEAMKLMNEIEAEVRGRIVSIVVENAQPVEYGQPLFLLERL